MGVSRPAVRLALALMALLGLALLATQAVPVRPVATMAPSSVPVQLDDIQLRMATHQAHRHALVFFYTEWCDDCRDLEDHFNDAAVGLSDFAESILVGRLDGEYFPSIARKYSPEGFPSLALIPREDPTAVAFYEGPNDVHAILDFVRQHTGLNALPPLPRPRFLQPLTGYQMLEHAARGEQHVVALLYAPWCYHSTRMLSVMERVAALFATEPTVLLIRVDLDESPYLREEIGTVAPPSLVLFPRGAPADALPLEFGASRDLENIVDFINRQTGTQRHHYGGFLPEVGRLPELDRLAADFAMAQCPGASVTAGARAASDILRQTAQHMADGQFTSAEVAPYLAVMQGALHEPGFIGRELRRLERLVHSRSITQEQADRMHLRANVLRAFVHDCGQRPEPEPVADGWAAVRSHDEDLP
ncbi:hypothetical protein H696_03616 [Fonticula alba]|uniref:protein disulfide-isomerase n=1 Tax=Fonticula alba TaxID=691883 RepID=A0A058Z7R6_FONAL|nr:hypothetical protein H696_03616 [Fonticula alba]KCV70156.1 hypothetical protein H696_03616 [Fonticula alba]|eukprot:XP_009495762.1 hypothetical protein H696_03616 [Fonticula alba]